MGLLNIFKRKDDFNSQASSYLSEAKELADILNVANDPNEYFKAYNELIEILHKLISFENHVKFKGKMPSEILDDVLDQKEISINNLINRYWIFCCNHSSSTPPYDRFHKSLEKYQNHLSATNISLYKSKAASIPNDNTDKEISRKDMERYNRRPYQMCDMIYYEGKALMLLNTNNQFQALQDICSMNTLMQAAKEYAEITDDLFICTEEIKFDFNIVDKGKPYQRTEYYTYIECTPFTPKMKDAKYPYCLHFATENLNKYQPDENYFDRIYYMQDGNIGKSEIVYWIKHKMYVFYFGMIGSTLTIKKVETNTSDGNRKILYKMP